MFTVPSLGVERPEVPLVEACEERGTRDVQVNELIWVRIFLPHIKQEDKKPKPLVLYAHGGAYCFGQPNWPPFHDFCSTMAQKSNSIWLSISYRLAPEHRLPAAYDDGSAALRWLVSQAQLQASHASDPWLTKELADFSNCFLAGESAGASIMLKVAMDAATSDLSPVYIKGLLLIHPGFQSEEKRGAMVDKEFDNLQIEKLYDLALPPGETLNYAPINPLHPAAPPLTPLSAYPHILVAAAEADFRYDMTLRFYKLIQGFCPHVELVITAGKDHVFHLFDNLCPEADDLHSQLVSFIQACTTT
eukprot:c18076_g1_i1 orf=130-1041(+)